MAPFLLGAAIHYSKDELFLAAGTLISFGASVLYHAIPTLFTLGIDRAGIATVGIFHIRALWKGTLHWAAVLLALASGAVAIYFYLQGLHDEWHLGWGVAIIIFAIGYTRTPEEEVKEVKEEEVRMLS